VDEIFTLAYTLDDGRRVIKDLKFTETVVDKVEEVKPTNFLELLHTVTVYP
jgi:hypothetical protein